MQNQANTQTIQNTVLNYRLTQINLSERTGKLVVKVNGKQKTFNVTLSALLVSYIEKGQFEGSFGKHVTSISFNSTLRDPEYKNNPFRLVKFEDDVYKLYLVTEAKPKKIEHPCPVTGEIITEYKNRYTRKRNFIRYIDATKKK